MYLDLHYFPIYLFNRYNDIEFQSFDAIRKLARNVQKRKKFDFEKIFHFDNETELFTDALTNFPFIFFLPDETINSNTLQGLFKDNPRVTDESRLLDLYKKRINMKQIQYAFNKINGTEGCSANWSNFITDFFIILYKYAFYEITMSIRISDNDITIKDYMRDYKNYEKRISVKGRNSFLAKGQLIQAAFGDSADVANLMMTELKIISKSYYFSKLLFAVIERNIVLNDLLSNKSKNRLLRPLFYEVVCNLCYYEDFKTIKTNDRFIVEKFRLFLREYNKKSENIELP